MNQVAINKKSRQYRQPKKIINYPNCTARRKAQQEVADRRTVLFLSTANADELRRLAEGLGIVNDDRSFDEFVQFLYQLIATRLTRAGR